MDVNKLIEVLRKLPNSGDWRVNKGRQPSISVYTRFDLVFRNGEVISGVKGPDNWYWKLDGEDSDIILWRISYDQDA